MKVSSKKMNRSNRATQKTASRRTLDPLLPAILLLGGATLLAAKPASAIELGQLQVDSTLGQPLSASIAYVLNPHEELHSYCISLTRSAETGVQSLTRASIKLVGDRIVITGSKPINEPMLAMRVAVNCPYTVRLARDFVIMINPAGTVDPFAPGVSTQAKLSPVAAPPRLAPVVADVAPAERPPITVTEAQSVPAIASVADQPAVPMASARDESPLFAGDDYRVQNGDTLSKIAKRVDGRPIGLWPSIDAIFQANPDAFVANDKNRLIAGSLLFIPDMQGYAAAPVQVDDPAPVESYEAETAPVANTSISYAAYESNNNQWAEEEVAVADADDTYNPETSYTSGSSGNFEAYDSTAVATDDTSYIDDTAVLASGNIDASPDAGSADVVYGEQTVVDTASDTLVADPVAETESPVSAEAAPKTVIVAKPLDSSISESPPWLIWAGGGGAVVFVLGLLFALRRKIGGLFGDDNAERVEPALEDDSAITQTSHVLSDVDFPLDDAVDDDHSMQLDADLGDGMGLDDNEAPEIAFAETTELDIAIAATTEASAATALDADLGAGTGLQDGTDLDVAQDFGFSATGENATPMDLELPVEAEVEPEELPTDIIPPKMAEPTTILEEEVPPVEIDDDSQYDLSMIVDATKQALSGADDLTAKNLNAVQLDTVQRAAGDSAQTLSTEVDFEVLEQDYEEELTQTQAVNEEITRAAMELTQRMETEDENEVLDVTAEMPARNTAPAENDDGDATALSEALTLNEEITVKINLDDDDTVDTKNLG